MISQTWPTTELDTVRRLRVVADATRAPMYADCHLETPFADSWAVTEDLERLLPHLITDIRSFRILSADGERLEARAIGGLGQRARFRVTLKPGWCLMQSRFVVGGMAARPDGDGTRFAIFGGLRAPGVGLLRPALAPWGGPMGSRSLQRLRSLLELG